MNILITGGSGTIGQSLYQNLSQNHQVNILTRSPKKDNEFYWNPNKGEIDIKALENTDIIIHLAGASVGKKWSKAYKQEIMDSRLNSTNLIFNKCKEHNITLKQFIGASAIGFYGETEDMFVDENSDTQTPDFLSEVCIKWEQAEQQFESMCPTAIVRIGFVIGNGFDGFNKLITPIKLFAGAPLGSGQQYMSWIHIDDLVGIFSHIIENGKEGIFNGVAPNPVTNEALTKAIAKKLKRPLILPNVPLFALKMLLGEMAAIAITGNRVSAQKLIDDNFNFKFPEIKTALEDLLS